MDGLSGMHILAPLPDAVRLALGMVFLAAFIGKLRAPHAIPLGVSGYGLLPGWLVRPVAVTFVVAEAFIAGALLVGMGLDIAIPVAVVLSGAFLVAVVVKLRQGEQVRCACFGDGDETVSGKTAARLVVLLVATVVLLVRDATTATAVRGIAVPTAEQAVLTVVLLLSGTWVLEAPTVVALVRGFRRDMENVAAGIVA